jgi:hypothetical protein
VIIGKAQGISRDLLEAFKKKSHHPKYLRTPKVKLCQRNVEEGGGGKNIWRRERAGEIAPVERGAVSAVLK